MDIHLESPKWGRSLAIIIIGFGIFISLIPVLKTEGQKQESQTEIQTLENLVMIEGNSLLATAEPFNPPQTVRKISVVITAYSSTRSQTDNDPFITAAGTWVEDGIVANNLLPFGTKIKIPELYGDRVFTVEDRMHWKKGYYHVDIWFASYGEAKDFGAKRTYIEVLEN